MRAIFKNVIKPGVIDKSLFNFTAKALINGLDSGYDVPVYTDSDKEMVANLKANLYQFSAAKTLTQIKEMSSLLTDGERTRSFAEFKKEVAKVYSNYNINYLQAEYNQAIGSARMAANWVSIQADKDTLPYLQYKTVGDSHVRESHKALDNIIRPVDDPFWDTYYPPNDWNCRCDVIQIATGKETPLPKNLPAISKVFSGNNSKNGVVFNDQHPYFNNLSEAEQKNVQEFIKSNVK